MREYPFKDNHWIVMSDIYDISLDQCSSSKEILYWCRQLSDKNWITQKMIDEFIRLAKEHHGISDRILFQMVEIEEK